MCNAGVYVDGVGDTDVNVGGADNTGVDVGGVCDAGVGAASETQEWLHPPTWRARCRGVNSDIGDIRYPLLEIRPGGEQRVAKLHLVVLLAWIVLENPGEIPGKSFPRIFREG